MTLAQVFDRLTSRVRQRLETAQERIEAAAVALSRGQSVDVAGLEDSLHDAGLTVDDFRKRVDFYQERREHLDRLDKLATARTLAGKLEKQIAAEEAKNAEIVDAFRKRWSALRAEADAAEKDVSAARDSRDWLLDPKHVPLPMIDRYRAAVEKQSAAESAVAAGEREVRELRQKIKSESDWLAQIAGEEAREIHAPEAVVTVKQRQKLSGQAAQRFAEHEKQKARFERRLVEAEKTLLESRAALSAAETALAALQKAILAT